VSGEERCYLCGKILTEEVCDDSYCCGCGEYICDDCDETEPMGNHSPEDHKSSSLAEVKYLGEER